MPVAAVLGEGVYGLTAIASSTSPVYWVLQIIGGGALLTAALRTRGMRPLIIAVAVIGTLLGVVAFNLFYRALGGAL